MNLKKNAIEGFDSSFDYAEKGLEIIQSEKHKEKKKQRKNSLRNLWDTINTIK